MATRSPSDLVEAALELAQEQPVLALRPGGKRPLPGLGLQEATQTEETIIRWWSECPGANIGIRADGLLIIDVDGETGEASLLELERKFGPLPATRAAKTGKGYHLHFASPTLVGNSTAPLGRPPGIDLRGGTRGYVVAPPSRHESGRRYEWVDTRPPVPLPASWRQPLTAITYVPTVERSNSGAETGYGRAALGRELERLLRATPGQRNEALNLATFRLAQLVGGGQLPRDRVEETLRMAASMLGLGPREAALTIRSGMAAGLNFPRSPRARVRAREISGGYLVSHYSSTLDC
jgi:Bifunctional DNA primase/polymerase, N-terminal